MRERILIRNADAVVTCDPADRVLYNSDILICGNRIEAHLVFWLRIVILPTLTFIISQ